MISFIIPDGHIMRHFPGSNSTGSVFYAKTPAELLTSAVAQFPEVFRNAQPDPKDGRKRLSFVAQNDIGLCNVVNINALTPEEKATITEEERDGCMIKVAISQRTFPTREFQIILDEHNTVITMFPGPLAPSLPKKGEHSEFWDNHVFIHNHGTLCDLARTSQSKTVRLWTRLKRIRKIFLNRYSDHLR